MKISDAIAGLANTMKDKGDLDLFFAVRDNSAEGRKLKSIPMVSGGWVNKEGVDEAIAFLSPEDLEEVVNE